MCEIDSAMCEIDSAMCEIDADVARDAARDGWHAIDNSDEPVETTVDRILHIGR
jgi:hypothetical protein